MSIFDRLNPARKYGYDLVKKSQTIGRTGGIDISFIGGKKATFFDLSDYEVITNGYNSNPYVYAVINRLSTLKAVVPFEVKRMVSIAKYDRYKAKSFTEQASRKALRLKEEAIENWDEHPANKLLHRPNARMSGYTMRKQLYTDIDLTGNMYIEAIMGASYPTELWALPPVNVTLQDSGNFYKPIRNAYFSHQQTQKTLEPEMFLHHKYYDPTGKIYGLSPLAAARKAVQQLNDGDAHNAALLQNGAKPEYLIMVPEGTPQEEMDKLKQEFESKYGGPYKAGRVMVFDEATKFESMGFTMKDMDFQQSQLANFRKVCDIYNVSSEIFNDPDNKTQANKAEAIRALYTDKILPDVSELADQLTTWLGSFWPNDNIIIEPDLSQVDALSDERGKVYDRLSKPIPLTMNQKLEEMGYERSDAEGMDEVWMPTGWAPMGSQSMRGFDVYE